jgi:glycosyltransferase involved in cell wall biosynthesis
LIISIIVSVYNIEAFLDCCLHSVQRQTFSDFECILVDDCSTDSSGEICDRFAHEDSRFKVIHKIKNEGLPQARKTGFENSSGDYIWFIDGDDWIESVSISLIISYIFYNHFPDCLFISFISNGITETFFADCRLSKVSFIEFCLKSAIHDGVPFVPSWAKVLKHGVVEKLDFPYISYKEDHYTSVQVLHYSDSFCTIPLGLYHYRLRPGSLETDKQVVQCGIVNTRKAVDFLLSRYPGIDPSVLEFFVQFVCVTHSHIGYESASPSVAVIVPVYNSNKFLEDCLHSVQRQTFSDFKCILVDDCSTDSSGEICDRFAHEDSRFKVIHFQKHWGTSYAREAAWTSCSDSYWVCFLDSDDQLGPYFLEDMLERSAHDDVDCIIGGRYNGTSFWSPLFQDNMDSVAFLDGLLKRSLMFPMWGKLFKWTFLRDVIFPNSIYFEDYVVLAQVMSHLPKLGLAEKALYLYNAYNFNSVSRDPSTVAVREAEEVISRNFVRKLLLDGVVTFDLIVTYGCNIGCKYCNHFTSLYNKSDVESFDNIKKSVDAVCSFGYGDSIIWNVVGGESLLHPQIIDILIYIREHSKGPLRLYSNGVLLPEMSPLFWQTLVENDVTLILSDYDGFTINMNLLQAHPDVRVYFNSERRYFYHVGLSHKSLLGFDVEFHQSPSVFSTLKHLYPSFSCNLGIDILTIARNRIYKCVIATHVEHFNKYFGECVVFTDSEYLNIDEDLTWERIKEFRRSPCNLCQYCGVGHSAHPWALSKKDKFEWLVKEDEMLEQS